MKKQFVFFLTLLLCMSMAACGSSNPSQEKNMAVSSESTDIAMEDPEVYARTKGKWQINGKKDTAYFVMNGTGDVTAYYATGNVEYTGYLAYSDGKYSIYTNSNQYGFDTEESRLIMHFSFDSDTQFHDDNDRIFIKTEERK